MNDLKSIAQSARRRDLKFMQLQLDSQDASNWRGAPSSRFRWFVASVNREGMQGIAGTPRYYKSRQIADAYGKANHAMYVVGKVKGFI